MNKKVRYAVALLGCAVLSGALFGTYSAQAHDNHSTTQQPAQATSAAPAVKTPNKIWVSKHVVFAETSVVDGQTVDVEYEAWFDENGNYRMNTTKGPHLGSFAVWDGTNFYNYNSRTNNILIVDKSQDTDYPVAHMFMSEIRNKEVLKDINNGTLKKKADKQLLKTDAEEFESVEDNFQPSDRDKHGNQSLFKDSGNKRVTTITLDKNKEHVLGGSTIINDQVVSTIALKQLDKNIKFDKSLLQVQIPQGAFVDKMKF